MSKAIGFRRRAECWKKGGILLHISVRRADWEAAVISEKSFGNTQRTLRLSIEKNGRILIEKDGNQIFLFTGTEYDKTIQNRF